MKASQMEHYTNSSMKNIQGASENKEVQQ